MNHDEQEQLEDEEQSRREAYESWLDVKREIAKDDQLLPYEPRDREQLIDRHELSTEKENE